VIHDDDEADPVVLELRDGRLRLGWSQQMVADRIGTSQSAVSEMERGEASPTLRTFRRYAAVLGYRLCIRKGEGGDMPTNEQVADAFRALAELVQQHGVPGSMRFWSWRSDGRAERISAGMTDVTTEPYASEATKYVIYRGKLLDQPVEIMESLDD
jgi:transcriptional regulator with XRE-family HTH domain